MPASTQIGKRRVKNHRSVRPLGPLQFRRLSNRPVLRPSVGAPDLTPVLSAGYRPMRRTTTHRHQGRVAPVERSDSPGGRERGGGGLSPGASSAALRPMSRAATDPCGVVGHSGRAVTRRGGRLARRRARRGGGGPGTRPAPRALPSGGRSSHWAATPVQQRHSSSTPSFDSRPTARLCPRDARVGRGPPLFPIGSCLGTSSGRGRGHELRVGFQAEWVRGPRDIAPRRATTQEMTSRQGSRRIAGWWLKRQLSGATGCTQPVCRKRRPGHGLGTTRRTPIEFPNSRFSPITPQSIMSHRQNLTIR